MTKGGANLAQSFCLKPMKSINCVSNCSNEIPEQCLNCGKLKTCLDLNAIKWDPCKSKDEAVGVYDPLIDFKPDDEQ